MKTLRLISLTTIFAILSIIAFAQQNMEDVVYLKNGNIYRGLIIEQVPGETLKIQTVGGNVFTVVVTDIAKITKENKVADEQPAPRDYERGNMHSGNYYHSKDSARRQYQFRKKGYFFQGQLLLENLQGGVRIVNGYKFGRFGYIGIGIGIDMLGNTPFTSVSSNGGPSFNSNDISGVYLPLYLYYEGDILKKRITPFYTLEAGYCLSPGGGMPFDMGNNFSERRGGAMGGVGFGAKFNTRRKVNFSLLANLNFKNIHYRNYLYYYDDMGNYSEGYSSGNVMAIIPGIRFGIGF